MFFLGLKYLFCCLFDDSAAQGGHIPPQPPPYPSYAPVEQTPSKPDTQNVKRKAYIYLNN